MVSTQSSLRTISFLVLAFFVENRLNLPTITTLLPVITLLFLHRVLPLLVLCHFVGFVLSTLLPESPAGFRNVYHVCESAFDMESKMKSPQCCQLFRIYLLSLEVLEVSRGDLVNKSASCACITLADASNCLNIKR